MSLLDDAKKLNRAEIENRETRIEMLEQQLAAERKLRERAEAKAQVVEADNAALMERGKHLLDEIDQGPPYHNIVQATAIQQMKALFSQSHPGDPLREELERLRKETTDPSRINLLRATQREASSLCIQLAGMKAEAERYRGKVEERDRWIAEVNGTIKTFCESRCSAKRDERGLCLSVAGCELLSVWVPDGSLPAAKDAVEQQALNAGKE
jgi:hypothetical protein